MQRFRNFTALVSIALLGVDAVVGALGHTHRHDLQATACLSTAQCHVGGGCCHDHDAGCNDRPERSSRQQSDSTPHEDCTLCRHLSQPVAPVAVMLVVADSVRIEPFVPRVVQRIVAHTATTHPARGPPLV